MDCTFTIDIKHDFTDVKMYYKIGNFYANHRNFVKSRSYPQLWGKIYEDTPPALCGDTWRNEEFSNFSWAGNPLDKDGIASPCGLIAKYRFTDSYSMVDSSGASVAINEDKIAHAVDRSMKFKRDDTSSMT